MIDKKQQLKEFLFSHLQPERAEKIERVTANRTNYITVVLEDLYQEHNVGAVLRTCECLGINNLHLIDNSHKQKVTDAISIGAAKWINLYHYEYQIPSPSITKLKQEGYRIIATSPAQESISMENLKIDQKTAFLFGSEKNGLTNEALQMADEVLKIPILGFSESYNVSVSAALILHHALNNAKTLNDNWKLNEEELIELNIKYAVRSLKRTGQSLLNNYANQLGIIDQFS